MTTISLRTAELEDDLSRTARTQFVLRKLILEHGDAAIAGHRWVWEKDRWKEFVLAIIVRVSGLDGEDSRVLVEQMDALGLLSMRQLSAEDDQNDPFFAQISELFDDLGIASTRGRAILVALNEAATYFVSNYEGRTQKMLREVGEQLVKKLHDGIDFSTLSESDSRFVLTYWLQNVLELPLSLKDDSVLEFAARHSISPAHLFNAADEMGINVAFLDDLTNHSQHENKLRMEENGDGIDR